MSQALSKTERSAFEECKAVIERGLESFTEVGNALLRIRNERMYRVDYGTFQEFCETEYQMSKIHAYRLIDAAEISENLKSNQLVTPEGESQVRPLKALEPEQQREAWQQATDTAKTPGKPTAKEVKLVVDKVTNSSSQTTSRASSPATPENDSELLSLLKSYWRAANRTERAKFLSWIKQQ